MKYKKAQQICMYIVAIQIFGFPLWIGLGILDVRITEVWLLSLIFTLPVILWPALILKEEDQLK